MNEASVSDRDCSAKQEEEGRTDVNVFEEASPGHRTSVECIEDVRNVAVVDVVDR